MALQNKYYALLPQYQIKMCYYPKIWDECLMCGDMANAAPSGAVAVLVVWVDGWMDGRGGRFERWKWNGMHKTMCTIYRYCSQLMRLEIRTPPPVSWLLLTDDTLYIWRATAYHQPASSSSTYFAVCMVQWNNDRIRKYSSYVYVAECAIKRPTYS